MDRVATAFFDGQHEGVWIVLEALYESENNEDREINREWVIRKLDYLMLNDFTE